MMDTYHNQSLLLTRRCANDKKIGFDCRRFENTTRDKRVETSLNTTAEENPKELLLGQWTSSTILNKV